MKVANWMQIQQRTIKRRLASTEITSSCALALNLQSKQERALTINYKFFKLMRIYTR